ncbi:MULTISPECIES: oxygenase MpaB family protein [unclassified Kitasatospora]|uniref:oxygenase MpaB family protein n=1 Tax=unclassified Kitasatospora TaxID=2633591 RepID=UPI0033F44048
MSSDTFPCPRDRQRADAGLFGPSSVTWHLHADPAMWIGGISALHLQALHPIAALGIAQNSSFEDDPFGRLVGTGSFIVATTWGTRAQAEQADARVRAVHERLRIHDPHSGAQYRLDAPDLLLWVHCALVRSNLHAVRQGGMRLTSAAAAPPPELRHRLLQHPGVAITASRRSRSARTAAPPGLTASAALARRP